MAPAMASKAGIPIALADMCSLFFSNRQLGRKPVWNYPHARGYYNCFLRELYNAVWLPNKALPCIFVFDIVRRSAKDLASDKSVIESALRTTLYGTTATFGTLASLSLAGVEYRRLELIERKHCCI